MTLALRARRDPSRALMRSRAPALALAVIACAGCGGPKPDPTLLVSYGGETGVLYDTGRGLRAHAELVGFEYRLVFDRYPDDLVVVADTDRLELDDEHRALTVDVTDLLARTRLASFGDHQTKWKPGLDLEFTFDDEKTATHAAPGVPADAVMAALASGFESRANDGVHFTDEPAPRPDRPATTFVLASGGDLFRPYTRGPGRTVRDIDRVAIVTPRGPERTDIQCTYVDRHHREIDLTLLMVDIDVQIRDRRTGAVLGETVIAATDACPQLELVRDGDKRTGTVSQANVQAARRWIESFQTDDHVDTDARPDPP